MSPGDSESVPYINRTASGPQYELSKSRRLNQSCGDARNPNLTSSSSCAQIRQYRIPDGSEFMKFSVRIPILNFRKYSAQVQVTPENSESIGILVLFVWVARNHTSMEFTRVRQHQVKQMKRVNTQRHKRNPWK